MDSAAVFMIQPFKNFIKVGKKITITTTGAPCKILFIEYSYPIAAEVYRKESFIDKESY